MRRGAVAMWVGLAVVLVGCVPPEEPAPVPTWQPTVHAWSDEPRTDSTLTATNEQWWAVAERTGTNEGFLRVYPRTGPGGAPAAQPAATIALDGQALALEMSDELIAYRAGQSDPDDYHVGLIELDGGTWSAAGWVARPMVEGSLVDLDVTDDAVVVGLRGPSAQPGVVGSVEVVPLDRSGPYVEWSPATVQVLSPDAGWPAEARHRFGDDVSIEGDLLAVGTEWDRVALYRRGTTWDLDEVLVGDDDPLLGATFGRVVSLDASGAPRLAVGSAGGWNFGVPQAGSVEVFEATDTTWTSTDRIDPRPGSGLNGLAMGSAVALDGDTLAVAAHWTPVPRPGGVGMVDDLRLEVHDLDAADTFVTELSTLEALGGVEALPTASSVGAMTLDLRDTHLAVSVWVGFGVDPSRSAAISYDLR